MSIQYRPELNPLTKSKCYSVRFVPHKVAGREDIAADISLRHPNFSKEDILTILKAEDEVIGIRLLNGEQVTKEGCCTWYPSFSGTLDQPNAQMASLLECLQLNVRISAPYLERIRRNAQVERLPMTEKLPVITATEDAVLELKDVLRSDGMLRITGNNISLQRDSSVEHCLIEGTHDGSAVQRRLGPISNKEIILMPDIPTQAQSWQNEYRLSITTRYTSNGTARKGTYRRLLRTILGVRLGENAGILSGSGELPLVTVTNGTMTSESARLRIQAVYHGQNGTLRLSLLDMQEGGTEGDWVQVSGNGSYTLPGYAGSEVSSLELTVADYPALLAMVRSPYGGRLVDVLDVTTGT